MACSVIEAEETMAYHSVEGENALRRMGGDRGRVSPTRFCTTSNDRHDIREEDESVVSRSQRMGQRRACVRGRACVQARPDPSFGANFPILVVCTMGRARFGPHASRRVRPCTTGWWNFDSYVFIIIIYEANFWSRIGVQYTTVSEYSHQRESVRSTSWMV